MRDDWLTALLTGPNPFCDKPFTGSNGGTFYCRALWRLVAAHRDEYEQLRAEELLVARLEKAGTP